MFSADLFSRPARRRQSQRAFASDHESRWLLALMADEISERLGFIGHSAQRCLILGPGARDLDALLRPPAPLQIVADPSWVAAQGQNGVQCDEDRLPFADGSFDLIVAAGGLDSVNDLPGALILIRKALAPGGLFLGAMAGAGSLPWLRSVTRQAQPSMQAVSRCHPQIDVQAAGDLLSRAGFARPVADSQQITARYSDLFRLIADLRANAMSNCLTVRKALRRDELTRMVLNFRPDGKEKVEEIFALLFLTGWAAQPS
jgi:NADH dehydrogenase [ubiquinone] 1 alpha subcomplex assembly factor 5